MSRAGREPAEDVKRRLVAACQEVGLTVSSANMIVINEKEARVIHVATAREDWPHESPMLSVMASITMDGEWDRTVEIRCCATDTAPTSGRTPWMKGRNKVALEELIEQLRETFHEREQVIAAIKLGIAGPYTFKRSIWDVPDLLSGPDLDELK